MLERLQEMHPKEFCLPSENDIRSYINKLQTTKKKGGGLSVSKEPDELTRFLKQLTHRSPKMKPTEALLILKNSFPTASNVCLPSESQIERNFSYCKSQMNKVYWRKIYCLIVSLPAIESFIQRKK